MSYKFINRNYSKNTAFKTKKDKPFIFSFNNDEVEVLLYEERLINNYIDKQFNNKFKRLLKLVTIVLSESDASDEEYVLCIDELNRLKNLVINEYKKQINSNLYNLYIKKLLIIENKLTNTTKIEKTML